MITAALSVADAQDVTKKGNSNSCNGCMTPTRQKVEGVLPAAFLTRFTVRETFADWSISQCVYHPAPLTRPRASPIGNQDRIVSAPRENQRTSPYPTRIQHRGLPASSSTTPEMNDSAVNGQSSRTSTAAIDPFLPSPIMPKPVAAEQRRQMSAASSYRSPTNSIGMRDNRTGFLGPTAYSAVFTENSGMLIFNGSGLAAVFLQKSGKTLR